MADIIPAIMPDSYDDLVEKVARVSSAVQIVQMDVMDGKFVQSRSWPYRKPDKSFEKILKEDMGLPSWDTVDYEVDMMVANPEKEIETWLAAGASRVVIHIESLPNPRELIEKYQGTLGIGLALGTETPIDAVIPYIHDIDFVQFMGIKKPGYQGEKFEPSVLNRITQLRDAYPELIISVDGGVTIDNARMILHAGATRLVSGSAIFDTVTVLDTIEQFRNL
jgi:ribulose-phosphate 3-epimerase